MINYYKESKIFKLDTKNTSYIFKISHDKFLIHLYYGNYVDDYALDYLADDVIRSQCSYLKEIGNCFSLDSQLQEYSFHYGDNNVDAIKINNAENYNLCFIYNGYEIKKYPDHSELLIELVDKENKISLKLIYSIYEEYDILKRKTLVYNGNDHPIKILKIASLLLDLEINNYDYLSLNGLYALERLENRAHIVNNSIVIDSKRGMSSHQVNPFFAILERETTLNNGAVYGFNLIYSGDFRIELEKNQYGNLRICYGINNDEFIYSLKAKDSFITPEAIMTYTNKGLNRMTINMHDFIKDKIMNNNNCRPIAINTWEGSHYDVDEKKVLEYIEFAHEIGADLVVLDDGWFGKRNDDHKGLGDWQINKAKFPNGFTKIIQKTKEYDLLFGLWIEPEMVNPDSDLYRQHPEYIIRSNREPLLSRNQYILDITKKEVQEYLLNSIFNLLDNNEINYLKWDMNRPFSEVGSCVNPGAYKYDYIMVLYEILKKIRNRYPQLIIESCAGGGGRFDLGMLQYSDFIWTSDNTSPIERNLIQDGTSIAYPLSTLSCHVTTGFNGGNMIETPLDYRYQVASQGVLGYELNITELKEADIVEISRQIREYKNIREIVTKGDYYRLIPAINSRIYAYNIVSKDKGKCLVKVLKNRDLCNQKDLILKLQGLSENKYYKNTFNNLILSGKTYQNAGIRISNFNGDHKGIMFLLYEVS